MYVVGTEECETLAEAVEVYRSRLASEGLRITHKDGSELTDKEILAAGGTILGAMLRNARRQARHGSSAQNQL